MEEKTKVSHFIPVDFNHDSVCGLTKDQWRYGVNVWEWVNCPACLELRPDKGII